ncbi:MAG: sugar phosphate nucleotidyltransferase [Flavobacteriaceae bacterium]|nr:sugar phosphate nucleotidyltransferase [Flavobacteriaceae bacterium]
MTLLLMAAGRGSRYGKLKQFDDLGPMGEFLMEFSIYDALQNGFDHIVVITQKSNVDFLLSHLSKRLPKTVKLDVLAQELHDLPDGLSYEGPRPKPWGTAHAVWTARHVIKNPFVVINADDYYGKNAYMHASNFMRDTTATNPFALVAYTLEDTLSDYGSVSRGVCEQKKGMLHAVVERTKLIRKNGGVEDEDSGLQFTGKELVSMNYWVCDPILFDHIDRAIISFFKESETLDTGEVYLPFVIQDMLKADATEVAVLAADSYWFGVTYSDDKEKAVADLRKMTEEGLYPSPLWDACK